MWGWVIYLVCVLGLGAESLRCGWSRPPSWHRALCKGASPRPQGAAVGGDAPQRCCGLTQVWLDPKVLFPPTSSPAGFRPMGVVLTCLRVGLAARSVDCGIRIVSGP